MTKKHSHAFSVFIDGRMSTHQTTHRHVIAEVTHRHEIYCGRVDPARYHDEERKP